MADEVVGSARIRIEPDLAGFDTALINEIEEALHQAARVVETSFRGVVTEVNRSLDAIGDSFDIRAHVDTSEISPAITAAVDAADALIVVTADSSGLTGDITAAVDAADTFVTVTGDASELTGDVTAAIDDADSHVTITGSVETGFNTDVLNLGANIADASDEASGLKKVIAGLSAAGLAAGINFLAEAASDLQESTSKAQVVFGEGFQDIADFAEEAATSTGLANQEALEMTATFGNLFQALGVSREEASDLSPAIVQLGADLASFNNIDVTDALEKLRSGLVGEIEPLRQIGVSFNAAQVEAKAYELGLARVGEEVSEGAKVQARYQLILEQTTLAQGDFARTQEGIANQQRILQAELKNTATAAGQDLLPAFDELLKVARTEVVPGLGEVAENILPAVSDALVNLAPLLGTTTDLLVAASPVIELVAETLALIPDEVIAVAGGFLLFNKAFGGAASLFNGALGALKLVPSILGGIASPLPAATSGVGGLASGITGLASSIATVNPLVALSGVVFTTLGAKWLQGRDEARRYAQEVDEVTRALKDSDGAVRISTEALAKYVETQSRFESKDQLDDLNRLGLTFDSVSALALDSTNGLDEFINHAKAGSEVVEIFRDEMGRWVDASGELINVQGNVHEVNGRFLQGNFSLIKSFKELQSVTQDAAEAQLETAVTSGLLSKATVDAALELRTAEDGTIDYTAALRGLQPQLDRAAAQTETLRAKYEPLAAAYLNTAEALGSLRDAAPEVASVIQSLRSGGEASTESFISLATSIDTAALSEEDFADAAAALGVSTEDLQGFVEETTQTLQEFIDTAVGGLPTVEDAFQRAFDAAAGNASGVADSIRDAAEQQAQAITDAAAAQIEAAGDALGEAGADQIRQAAADRAAVIKEAADAEARAVEENARVTATGLTDALRAQAEELADFRGDLDQLTDAGFGDLAGLLAQQGQEAGDALADELQTALANGNLEILNGLREANNAFKAESDATIQFITTELAPKFLSATGLLSAAITDTFGENLNFAEKVRIAAELAALKLPEGGDQIAAVAAVEGDQAARDFGKALNLDQKVIDAAVAAGNAIRNAPTDGAVEFGTKLGDGVAVGISQSELKVALAAQGLIGKALIAATKLAENASPSKLFIREVGKPIGEGIAIGISAAETDVVKAAEDIISAAAAAVSSVTLTPEFAESTADIRAFVEQVQPTVTGTSSSAAAGGTVVNELINRVGEGGFSGPLVGTMIVNGNEPEQTVRLVESSLRRVQVDLTRK